MAALCHVYRVLAKQIKANIAFRSLARGPQGKIPNCTVVNMQGSCRDIVNQMAWHRVVRLSVAVRISLRENS